MLGALLALALAAGPLMVAQGLRTLQQCESTRFRRLVITDKIRRPATLPEWMNNAASETGIEADVSRHAPPQLRMHA